MLGLDYAGSSPGSAAVKAAGFGFVARYLSRYSAKTIKKPEYDDMTNNGVGVVLVFEDYANQALQGYNQGVADAQFALAQANALGWPSSRPIHFAVDFDISDAQKPAAGEYMKGVASVIGLARTGAYGGYWWIKYCAENNLAAPNARWQAVAWSGGNIHPSATLFQQLAGTVVNGTSCDINRSLQADFGQNNTQGEDMITDADNEFARWNKLFTQIRGRAATREEFRASAVGLTWLNAMEILSDSPEADAATSAAASVENSKLWPLLNGDLNSIDAVINDFQNWKDYGVKASQQVADLQSSLKTDDDNIVVLKKKIADLEATPPTPTSDTPTKLPDWLQALINFLSGKK